MYFDQPLVGLLCTIISYHDKAIKSKAGVIKCWKEKNTPLPNEWRNIPLLHVAIRTGPFVSHLFLCSSLSLFLCSSVSIFLSNKFISKECNSKISIMMSFWIALGFNLCWRKVHKFEQIMMHWLLYYILKTNIHLVLWKCILDFNLAQKCINMVPMQWSHAKPILVKII